MSETVTAPAPLPRPRSGRLRRWWRRRPINRALVLAHRWPGLVLGLLLVVECTSGAVLLYNGELFHATHSSLYSATAAANPISADDAIATVDRARPNFHAAWAARDNGVWVVGEASYAHQWFVDPGTGHLNGAANTNSGFMALLVNIHDCAFTCAGYPGYNSWFATELWAGGPSFLAGITRGAFALGVLGLLMILLALTSLKIWWPGVRRLKQRFVVRRGRGRFARDYDLHNVIGAIALPFVLMWGITGAAFEFPVVENAWLAVTGGHQTEQSFVLQPDAATKDRPTISTAAATTAAVDAVPGSAASFIGLPAKGADYYEIDVITGYASSEHRLIYRGDAYVLVDAHNASHLKVINSGEGPLANRFYDKFLEPTHFGWNVNGWWRLLWLTFGLAPLALMITGVSTWLWRRSVRRRRRRLQP